MKYSQVGAHHQQEAQVPPAIAEAAQVRRPVTAVGVQDDRHLADLLLVQRCLDHHLAGELHARRPQVEPFVGVLAEGAQAAVGVADGRAEEEVQDAGQDRVADVPVVPGHGAGADAALEAVAHDQLIAGAEALDERVDGAEVVGIVGVAHDDVLAAGSGNARLQGRAVTALGGMDHPAAGGAGQVLRAVGAAVVGHHDLAADAQAFQCGHGLGHALADGQRLVEARHDHCHFEFGRRRFDRGNAAFGEDRLHRTGLVKVPSGPARPRWRRE